MYTRDFLPDALNVPDVSDTSQFTFCAYFACNLLDLNGKYVQLVNHLVDGLNQIEHLSRNGDTDNLLVQVTMRHSSLQYSAISG